MAFMLASVSSILDPDRALEDAIMERTLFRMAALVTRNVMRKMGRFLTETMQRRNVGVCWESGKEVLPSGMSETLTLRDFFDIYSFSVVSASHCSTLAGGSSGSADAKRTFT